MNTVSIPEWVVVLVGRLTMENESLRQALVAAQAAQNGQVPESEPVES